ncbi:hypothetical protein DUI70_6746 [Streptomyces albus]|nr:hypothetical protein DUI70_6746 [Streptomyces albus]
MLAVRHARCRRPRAKLPGAAYIGVVAGELRGHEPHDLWDQTLDLPRFHVVFDEERAYGQGHGRIGSALGEPIGGAAEEFSNSSR